MATPDDISSDLKNRLKIIKEENTYLVNAGGFFNKIKALFGKAAKVSVFDLESFKANMTELIHELIKNAEEELRIDSNSISTEINGRMIAVNEKYQTHIYERIEHYQSWRERTIQGLVNELKGKKGKALDVVAERERLNITFLRSIKQLEHLYEEEFVEKGWV